MVKNILAEKDNAFKKMIQLEKLENRQLLATVTGGGEEVGSDISYQGNVYDQVLMQGAAVSVEADPGQIVRVSWIDGNGDITQGEFSGDGTFTVSLDDFGAAAEPENYNQPGVEYASGLASITIEGSNSSSNVSVFTVGPTTSHNFGALDAGVDLDGVADIARITIVADPSQPGGSTFGGIRTANAMYSDDTGVVGIAADGVQVQSVVLIGDIDASNSGIPTLLFGDSSQFGTVQVAGGDLAQSNGEAINDGGFQTVSFIDGMTSDGVLQPSGTFLGAFASGEQRVTALDTSTEINIDGMSQSELDATFAGKTFTEDVMITGDLAQYQRISAGEFQKSITFDGNYSGSITVGTVGGDITFMGTETGRTISSNITAGSLGGSLTFGSDTGGANYSGTLRTPSMAAEAVQVFGNFTGTVTTDGDGDLSFDDGEGALGDISVSGDFSGNVVGILGIGNITVGGNLTSEGGSVFYTSSDDAPRGDSIGGIGTLTVMGDVDQDAGDMLINIANNGIFGAITLMGGGTDVGRISINGSQLGGSNGDISITGSYHVDIHGIDVGAGTLGNITITGIPGTGVAGDKNEVSMLTLGNVMAGSSIGNVSISGSDRLSLNDIMTRTAGMLDFGANMSIAANGPITASHQAGSVTFTGSTSINADITSDWMGPVMFDGSVTFADGMGLVAGNRAGVGDIAAAATGRLTSFDVTGNTTFNSASGANIELGTGGSFTFGGMVSGTDGSDEIVASSLGGISFTAALSGRGQTAVEDLSVRVTPGGGDKVAKDGSKATDGNNLSDYSIGNISVESTNTIGIPGASLFAGNNVFHALGAIGDISLSGGGSPTAQTPLFSSDADSLLFIVGDTTGNPTSAPTIDFDGDGTDDSYADLKESVVSIGNVSINVGPNSDDYNSFDGTGTPDATAAARFTGMNILSGVHAASDDQINAVSDRYEDISGLQIAYNTAQGSLTTAQGVVDDLLDGENSADLVKVVDDAKAVLGTAEDTADDDTAYGRLAAAQEAVDSANDALKTGAEQNAAVEQAKIDLGAPASPGEAATGAYGPLATAQTELAANTSVSDAEDALNIAKAAVTTAETAVTTAETAVTTAENNLANARADHSAAQSALNSDNDADDTEYTTAYIAEKLLEFDLSDATGDQNLGRIAYIANAVLDEMSTEAEVAWTALTADEMDTQGFESYDAADDEETGVSRAVWLGLSDAQKEAQGKEAWVAQFISLPNGTTTAADTAGNTARTEVTEDAEEAYDDLAADAAAEAGLTAVRIMATRDVAANIEAETGDNHNTAMATLITELNTHVGTYVSAVTTAEAGVTTAEGNLETVEDAVGPAETAVTNAKEAPSYVELVDAVATANENVIAAQLALAEAIANATGTTTVEDVAAAITARDTAQEAFDAAQKVLDDANAALPVGLAAANEALAAAQKAYDAAKADLLEIGAKTLGDDEILIANDADVDGTIGNVDIRNMVTLIETTGVSDITDADALSISVGSASGIVGATDVGSMDTSKQGMIIGGDDTDLEENELLVYVV